MKKLVAFVMMTIVALICTFTFVSCSNTDGDNATLVMNKRYINENYVSKDSESQLSYIFHADGTGEYTYHYDYSGDYSEMRTHYHYIIHFKYTYVDADKSTVACFYDSIERLDGDDGTYTSTTWSQLVNVSKNVLATAGTGGYVFWINEDYLKTLSHFGIGV